MDAGLVPELFEGSQGITAGQFDCSLASQWAWAHAHTIVHVVFVAKIEPALPEDFSIFAVNMTTTTTILAPRALRQRLQPTMALTRLVPLADSTMQIMSLIHHRSISPPHPRVNVVADDVQLQRCFVICGEGIGEGIACC